MLASRFDLVDFAIGGVEVGAIVILAFVFGVVKDVITRLGKCLCFLVAVKCVVDRAAVKGAGCDLISHVIHPTNSELP